MDLFVRSQTSDPTSKYLVVIIYTLAVFRSCADGSLTIKPVNIEAVVGQRVQLSCSTSEPYYVLWDHAAVGSTPRHYVFFSGVLVLPYSRRVQMDRNNATGRYNLVIPSVQKEDAGNYRCMDMVGHGEQAEAELIVIDSNPQCNTDVVSFCDERTSQDFKVSCTVGFTGNLFPKIECFDTVLVMSPSEVTERLPQSVTYSMWLTTKWPLDDSHPIVCRTSISHISAMVNPTVMYAFGSSQSVTMDHRKTVTVDCRANSSEQCSYQWIHKDTGVVINSETLTTNKSGQYRCQATCMLRDHSCTVTPLVVELTTQDDMIPVLDAATDNDRNDALITGVTVGVVLCIIVAVCGVVLTMKCRMKGHRKSSGTTEGLMTVGNEHTQTDMISS